MNSGPLLYLGIFFTMACSWLGFVLGPRLQIGNALPEPAVGSSDVYPTPRPGQARQGEQVYRSLGCAACHTQQVRPGGETGYSDTLQGFGARPSVAADYLNDQPAMPGSVRIGPDLSNIGVRQDEKTLLLHLYQPKLVTLGSIMPSYRFLFEHKPVHGERSPDALKLSGGDSGFEVVPKPEALALVAYLHNLRQNGYLFEAPPPPQPAKPSGTNAPPAAAGGTNAPAAGATNAPAAATNAPAK